MSTVATAASLPPARRRLVTLMQEVNFGSIYGLHVRNREPVLDPPPRVVREVKFCAENGPRPEVTKQDFALKAQVLEFFAEMDTIGDDVIERIEIKHGLPFRMTVEEDAA